ncbi:MAG TPA: ABC transporter permease [Lachnospiraceae bacterium]|nr:ABC transporter permease [Lachnospiraceae bacterium]
MNGAKQIIKKELNRVFGDKKMLFSLFLLPVLIMVGMCYLMGNLVSNMEADVEEHVPVVYIQEAPEGFQEFLSTSGYNASLNFISADESTDAIKDDIVNGKADLLVTFEKGFVDSINSYTEGAAIPEIKTYYNPSEEYSSTARTNFLSMVLEPYRQNLLSQRISDLNSILIFNVDLDVNASVVMDDEKASGEALGMLLPYFITMLLFAGVMSLAVDAITGEKERGTMASMLLSPVSRSEIVTGKLVSLALLSSLSAIIYAVGMIFALPRMMGNSAGDMSISITPLQIVQLLLIMVTLVFFYVSIVTIVAVYAKTVKEANTYVSPLYILVIVAGMITMYSGNSTPDTAMFAIPVYGSALCIQNIMTGELQMAQFAVNIASTIAISLLLTAGITKAFNSEKVMFNA